MRAAAYAIVALSGAIAGGCGHTPRDPGRERFLRIVQEDTDGWRTEGPPVQYDFLQADVHVRTWVYRPEGAATNLGAFSALRVDRQSRRVLSVSEVRPFVTAIRTGDEARTYADLLRSLGISPKEVPPIAFDRDGTIFNVEGVRESDRGFELVRRVRTPEGTDRVLVENVGFAGEYAFEWR